MLFEKAYFVSGRDVSSTNSFSELLRRGKRPVVQPEDVALVRDPVLSDNMLTDTKGTCWKQSEGASRIHGYVVFSLVRRTTKAPFFEP